VASGLSRGRSDTRTSFSGNGSVRNRSLTTSIVSRARSRRGRCIERKAETCSPKKKTAGKQEEKILSAPSERGGKKKRQFRSRKDMHRLRKPGLRGKREAYLKHTTKTFRDRRLSDRPRGHWGYLKKDFSMPVIRKPAGGKGLLKMGPILRNRPTKEGRGSL